MFLSFFDSFLTRKRLLLFEVIFLLRLDSLASKSVFVIKCACANLSLKTLASKLWSSNLLVMIMISRFLLNLTNFCAIICYLTLSILFSTAFNSVFVAKLLKPGILFSNSVSFVFFLAKSVTSVISFSNCILFVSYLVFKRNTLVSILFTLATNISYITFLTTSFCTTSLSLFKWRGTFANWSISDLYYF